MIQKLKHLQIVNAKYKGKTIKLGDGNGLYVHINQAGKYFRYNYRFNGKYKTLSYGVFDILSLEEARTKHKEAKALLTKGIDPMANKQEIQQEEKNKLENTFKDWALKWHKERSTLPHGQKGQPWSENHSFKTLDSLEKDVFPHIGNKPITDIGIDEIRSLLKAIEQRGALDMLKRVRSRCNAVFRYAMVNSHGKVTFNPVEPLKLSEHFATARTQNYKHLKSNEVGEFLRKLDGYGGMITKLAFQFHIYTGARPIETRLVEWKDINFIAKTWNVPAEKMKMNYPHIVPLSKQIIELLIVMKKLTGDEKYIFIGTQPNKPISEGTFARMINRLGYSGKCTAHGFRHTASTILNGQGFSPDAIERQLSHKDQDKVRGAYNHADYLPERVKMMQWYADYLDKLKHIEKVVELRKKT